LENTHERSCRWQDKGIREALLERWVEEPDFAWRMMDAMTSRCIRMRQVGIQGDNQAMGRTKGAQQETAYGRGCAGSADHSGHDMTEGSAVCCGMEGLVDAVGHRA